jgi:hypothetical protein
MGLQNSGGHSKMAFSLALFVSSSSTCYDSIGIQDVRIQHNSTAESPRLECAVVKDSSFSELTSSRGGAIYLQHYTTIIISDCNFRSCEANSSPGFGGACDLGSTYLIMTRCCGSLCSCYETGPFLFLNGDGIALGGACSDRDVSEITTLSCGGASPNYGTLYLDTPGTGTFHGLQWR